MSARVRTLRSPAARLRLLRRAAAVLVERLGAIVDTADAPAQTPAILSDAVERLARRGLATTYGDLEEYLRDGVVLAALEDGAEVEDFVDLDRFYGTRDEAAAWLAGRLERNVRGAERRMAGA